MNIKLRNNIEKLEVIKSIEFKCEYPNRFSGHITYKREYFNGYDLRKGDKLDELILNEIVSRFSETQRFNISQILLSDKQEEDVKTITKGGLYKDITIQFYPLTDIENYKKLSHQGKLAYTIKKLNVSIKSGLEENLNTLIFNQYVIPFDIENYQLLDTML